MNFNSIDFVLDMASINFTGKSYADFLEYFISDAVKFGKTDILDDLLTRDESHKIKTPLLQIAISESASIEIIQYLISNFNLNMNGETDSGLPFLHYFIQQKVIKDDDADEKYVFDEKKEILSYKVFKFLLECGADPNVYCEKFKMNILQYAVFEGQVIAVDLLIRHGANLNSFNNQEKSSFMLILQRQNAILGFKNGRYIPKDKMEYDRIFKLNVSKRSARNDLITTKLIIVSLARELARLEAAGEEISKDNLKCLRKRRVFYFYSKCKNEIEEMKNFMINNIISYFEFLTATKEELLNCIMYFGNKLTENIDDFFKTHYVLPIYRRVFRKILTDGIDRFKRLEKLSDHYTTQQLAELRNIFKDLKIPGFQTFDEEKNLYFNEEDVVESKELQNYDPENYDCDDFMGDDAVFDEEKEEKNTMYDKKKKVGSEKPSVGEISDMDFIEDDIYEDENLPYYLYDDSDEEVDDADFCEEEEEKANFNIRREE